MKTYFSELEFAYDGTQLRQLFAYLKFNVLDDSIIAWIGPCQIPFEHMKDGEDINAQSAICGDKMLHFIIEKFDVQLFSGVAMQRLLASMAIDILRETSRQKSMTSNLFRDGDDIFLDDKKLSISVAIQSPVSTLVHFAVNIVTSGTPVKTLCLQDLNVEPIGFAQALMEKFASEVDSMVIATRKVKC